MRKYFLSLLVLLLLITQGYGQSTINPTLPADGNPYSASVIRGQFDSAYNDINTLYGLNKCSPGSTAPATPARGQCWLDTSSSTWKYKIYDDTTSTWVIFFYLDSTNSLAILPVGGGTEQSLASATTVDLGSVPQAMVQITGTSTITSFGTSAPTGTAKFLTFSGALTLTNSASLALPAAGGNITTAAGDTAVAVSLGSGNWIVVSYTSAAGWPPVIGPGTLPTNGDVATWNTSGGARKIADGGSFPGSLVGGGVITSGPVTVSSANCGQVYALGGNTPIAVTVPAASGFPVGCSFTLQNVDSFPAYNTASFTATISGTTLNVTSVASGTLAVGQTLARAGITSNTQITALGSGTGGTGTYTVNNSQSAVGISATGQLGASFTATGSGTSLTTTSVSGIISVGVPLSGTGIPSNTFIIEQNSGTPGGAGVYTTNNPTTSSSATVTESHTMLSVSSVTAGALSPGDVVSGTGIPSGETVISQISGTTGGAGIYAVSITGTASATISSTPTVYSYGISGGREKTITGLNTLMLYPGQKISITSLGSAGWSQPTNQPRFDIPNGSSLRLFISTSGSSTNSGLGGCTGSPFDSIQDAMQFAMTTIDLRGSDPLTLQYCDGSYGAGTQALHMAVDPVSRNGAFGIRVTGSPVAPEQCPDSGQGVSLTAGSTLPLFDTELNYTWLTVDCMTLASQGAPMLAANRKSTLEISTGISLGAMPGSGQSQIAANGNSQITFDGNTVLNVFGDTNGTGYLFNLQGGGTINNLGNANIIFSNSPGITFSYESLFLLGQGANANLGGMLLMNDEGGHVLGNSIISDGNSILYDANPISASSGYLLTNGSCLSGFFNVCARGATQQPLPQGRLTLTSGVPVLTTAVTAAGTLYYTPYQGASCPIFDGNEWSATPFAETTLALDSNTGHTGYQASGSLYDVFAFNLAGTFTIGTGPAWSSSSSRGTGAGTTQLQLLNGIWTNQQVISLRYGNASGNTASVAVNQATYLGTIYATANGQTGMNFNPSAASGGAAPIMGVYNAYNRVRAVTHNQDSTSSWSYNTATWRNADASASNRISWVDGLGQSIVNGSYNDTLQNGTSGYENEIGIGWNGSNPAVQIGLLANPASSTLTGTVQAKESYSALGFNYAQAMEYQATGTGNYLGAPYSALTLDFDW